MATKQAVAALFLLLLVVGGELGHADAVPLRRALSIGWMNGVRGGSPGGMQPSDTAKLSGTATVGEESNHYTSAEEAKFIHTVPSLVRPPRLPPS
ncbi:hypothetical protein EJB05_41250 [Eragrostis curvula]|uniref:Uncharacterized protein n=1 Tax=Eragrostis curvula TaxID=38414 RepID=A0A5J9T911_9POAL|nr:hypothetical protein EJB05_41250 [Eragrostis curvula]